MRAALATILGAGVVGAAQPPASPADEPVPSGMEPIHDENNAKARMACLSNHRLRKMIFRYNQRSQGMDIRRFYRQMRWLIHRHPEHYGYLLSRGWVGVNPEDHLAAMWAMDKEWGFR